MFPKAAKLDTKLFHSWPTLLGDIKSAWPQLDIDTLHANIDTCKIPGSGQKAEHIHFLEVLNVCWELSNQKSWKHTDKHASYENTTKLRFAADA